MTIRVGDRTLLGPLMEALRSVGCLVAPLEEDRCEVFSHEFDDPRQAQLELRFFARAWASEYGTNVQVEAP